jgi:hypothetical protein
MIEPAIGALHCAIGSVTGANSGLAALPHDTTLALTVL